MYIKLIPCEEKDVLLLSQRTHDNLEINHEKIILHVGAWKEILKVRVNEELDDDTIGLPNQLAGEYTIPETLPYDFYLEGEHLFLGPVIAFFVGEGYLSETRIGKWKAYCQNYSNIGGLICFCTVEGVDIDNKTIRGYYYDPHSEETQQFKPGSFPYPGVVYRRARMDYSILKELHEHTNGKIFNARIFDKWEMWTVLSEAGFIHIPHTVRLDGPESLNKMLDLHNSVYLKPAIGRFGRGIQKVEKTPDGYLFKEKTGIGRYLGDMDAVFRLVSKYKNRKYIIQRAVPFHYQAKPVDFRVILQKDGSQKWTCSGIIAKTGIRGRIYTNNPSLIELGRKALQRIYGLSPEQAVEKENEMVELCTHACLLIERAYGHFGDVGIDVVIDENLKIWILEINKSHQHDIARYLLKDDPDMYNRVVSRPLEYAKVLAGF